MPNKTDYRNGGHVLKWHANSYEIALYDKLKDLQQAAKSPKRAFEDRQGCQMDLFKATALPKQMEVLRLEVRLNRRQLLKKLLMQLNLPNELKFYSLFNADISKTILEHFWNTIMGELDLFKLLEVDAKNPTKLAESIIQQHPHIKPAKVAQAVGSLCLFQQAGVGGMKSLFHKAAKRTVQRMIKECKQTIPTQKPRWLAIHEVGKQLKEFQPISLKNYYSMAQL